MTQVELRRLDDRFPPLRELLFVEPDGRFRMWRSNADLVGRLGGRVPDPAAFAELARAAAGERPPAGPEPVPDSAEDELRVGDRSLSTRPGQHAPGSWGDLLETCRGLLAALLDQPTAAVALELPAPDRIRIVHRGTEVLPIELGSMGIGIDVYRDTTRLGSAAPAVPEVHHVDAGPGWFLDVPVTPVDVPPGAMRLVRVQFVAVDDGVFVPVELSSSDPASPADS